MAVSQASTQVLRFATNIVLAHLLVPADFGIIAIGLTVTMFLDQIRDLGTGATIIQRKDVTPSLLNTVFCLNAAMGVTLGLVVFAGASPLAAALGNAQGTAAHAQAAHVLQAFALVSVLSSAANVHYALLRRDMRFRVVGVISTASALCNTVVSVALAVAGAGVWSIVAGLAAGTTLGAVAAWWSSGWRPRLELRLADLRSIRQFAAFLLLTNLVAFALQQSDRVVVNRVLGPALLGIYVIALQITTYPLTTVTSALTEVLFPAFARKQDDKQALRSAYVRANRVIALITFPLMAGTAAVAPLLVPVVLGEKWHAAVPLLIALGPAGALRSITANTGSLMLAQGRSRATFLSSAAFAAIVVTGFVVGIRWGLQGMCVTYTAVVVAVTPALCWVAFRDLDLRVRDYFRALGPLTLITLVMVAAVVGTGFTVPQTLPAAVRLAAQVLVGAAVYVGLLVRVRPIAYVDALSALRRRGGSEEQAAVMHTAG
jgi:PST family polysaccharide transporter